MTLLLSPVRVWHFINHWLPVVIWAVFIFVGSSDAGSAQHTSRILEPFLRWLNPNISAETIQTVQWIVRKGAHLTEYAILAILFWRARREGSDQQDTAWSWRQAAGAILFCAGYALTDEFHQHFVSTRQASIGDVLIDSGGACLGLALLWSLGRLRKRW